MVTVADACSSNSDLESRLTLLSRFFLLSARHMPPFFLDTHGIGSVRSRSGRQLILKPRVSIMVFGSHVLIVTSSAFIGGRRVSPFIGVSRLSDTDQVRCTCTRSSAILCVISTTQRIVSSLWICGLDSVKVAAQEMATTGRLVFHQPKAPGLLAFSVPTTAVRFLPTSASMLSRAVRSNSAVPSEGFTQPD